MRGKIFNKKSPDSRGEIFKNQNRCDFLFL